MTKNYVGWKFVCFRTNFVQHFFCQYNFYVGLVQKGFPSNIRPTVTSIEYLLIFSNKLYSMEFGLKCSEKEISKFVSDGEINKRKRKAAVERGTTRRFFCHLNPLIVYSDNNWQGKCKRLFSSASICNRK